MNQDISSAEPVSTKSSPLIKICLVGLPVGLIVTTTISFLFFFSKRENKIEAVTSQYAAMFHRDIQASDLAKYEDILGKVIGVRDLNHFDNIEATVSFIDSTMGYNNMGYRVMRQEFLHEKKSLFNLLAELPGQKQPYSVVLVVANYMTLPSEPELGNKAVASVFALAHALTGEKLDKTVRFVTVANLPDLELRQTGAWYLSKDRIYPKEIVEQVLYFEAPGFGAHEVSGWDQASHEALRLKTTNDAGSAALDSEGLKVRLEEYLQKIRQVATLPPKK